MKLLAIETSTDACSCALWLDGKLYERFEVAPRGHGALVLSMVEALFAEGEIRLGGLDGLAFGCGPGAFTGLRIAAGVIQGLAFSAELPVVPVSSLAALAQGVTLPFNPTPSFLEREKMANSVGEAAERVLVIQDARMGEVYYGAFERGPDSIMRAADVTRVCRPERVTSPTGKGIWAVVGSAWQTYGAALAQALAGCEIVILPGLLYPHAGEVARLGAVELVAGRGVSAEQALPVYVRDDVVGNRG
ncbi:tRNA threonylcarbamoyladenosine biosynthesis protein TsaB [Gammaproteobacteria bacterium]